MADLTYMEGPWLTGVKALEPKFKNIFISVELKLNRRDGFTFESAFGAGYLDKVLSFCEEGLSQKNWTRCITKTQQWDVSRYHPNELNFYTLFPPEVNGSDESHRACVIKEGNASVTYRMAISTNRSVEQFKPVVMSLVEYFVDYMNQIGITAKVANVYHRKVVEEQAHGLCFLKQ